VDKIKDTATRYHDFSCGHRVVGHEGKCALLHGHNYRIHFKCRAEKLDSVGRVIDFSVIKRLGIWLEENWDHKFLAWNQDRPLRYLVDGSEFVDSIVWVPFNPTAENIGRHLLVEVGPKVLWGTGATLVKVKVEETRKCSATAALY
jgi:6-pyruvoyltetrahydropterin/6-carboxytetrahydropterin synthase